ncbi:hypothetical protein WR25_07156 [Diploscapter pachys]|uniref:SGNH hydrolase-type esterase domain-containing protein n=1 Tax=Diploscapter pachys TaxID=2018661 RepID=A0A2A2J2H7_9BILA|nr:hypothetical protein WR25_07156 [Diploscapter pachys]
MAEVPLTWPGLAFHAGCAYDLEKHATIPNILKKFNPNLLGCSNATGTSAGIFDIGFNVARPGAKSDDLPFQAQSLVSALNANPKVNIAEDWKFLGIFIGTNDACQFCLNQHTPDYFVSKITEALEILRSNLPRTIVSILSIPQLDVISQLKQKSECQVAQPLVNIMCPCLANNQTTQEKINNFISNYFKLQMNLQNSGKFDADDFTVVVQPFITEIHEPSKNLSFFAPDCFHYSKLGHSLMSTFLWQSLLQPVNFKTAPKSLDSPAKLSCPDEKCPFIRTVKNSIDCVQFLAPAMK